MLFQEFIDAKIRECQNMITRLDERVKELRERIELLKDVKHEFHKSMLEIPSETNEV